MPISIPNVPAFATTWAIRPSNAYRTYHNKCTNANSQPRRVGRRVGRRGDIKCCTATSNVAKLRHEIDTIAGAERGIFGLQDPDREALEEIIRAVEAENPTTSPTANHASAAAGCWRLIYTTLEVLGRRRVKLAIATSRKPGLVKLGDFLQTVNPETKETSNVVNFSIMGQKTGTFTISANYEVASDTRVNVRTTGTALEPASLQKLLGDNESLLIEIFNPEGYLDITYVDESLRIGRDDKGQLFVLERTDAVPMHE